MHIRPADGRVRFVDFNRATAHERVHGVRATELDCDRPRFCELDPILIRELECIEGGVPVAVWEKGF